ncbi:hypothetical protein V3N99_08935 [Dermatophilaceae bacterium Soc4.6]
MLLSGRLPALADLVERWLLAGVVAAALLGLTFSTPAVSAGAHGGITTALVVLVLSTGVTLAPAAWRGLRPALPRITASVLVAAAVLPVLAWTVGLLLPNPVLRHGVLAAGVAPAEVASVALVAIAGGRAAVTVMIVAGSVLLAVLSAGAVLSLLGPAASFNLAGLLVQLLLIVALPLLAGSLLRTLLGDRPAPLAIARLLGVMALLTLLWQVSGQIQLTAAYAQATGVLALFLTGSIALGSLLGVGRPRPEKVALALPVGMRDFAIAAGIATTAYGPAAAAPLAGYGVLVLLYGTTHARFAAQPTRTSGEQTTPCTYPTPTGQ